MYVDFVQFHSIPAPLATIITSVSVSLKREEIPYCLLVLTLVCSPIRIIRLANPKRSGSSSIISFQFSIPLFAPVELLINYVDFTYLPDVNATICSSQSTFIQLSRIVRNKQFLMAYTPRSLAIDNA